jgi:hypothetical protein
MSVKYSADWWTKVEAGTWIERFRLVEARVQQLKAAADDARKFQVPSA